MAETDILVLTPEYLGASTTCFMYSTIEPVQVLEVGFGKGSAGHLGKFNIVFC